jgi:hypothetical protein
MAFWEFVARGTVCLRWGSTGVLDWDALAPGGYDLPDSYDWTL